MLGLEASVGSHARVGVFRALDLIDLGRMARTGCTRVTLEGLVFRQLLFEALDLGVEVPGFRKGGRGGRVQGRDNPGLRSQPG